MKIKTAANILTWENGENQRHGVGILHHNTKPVSS
jgi:hypothetical protein